MSHRKGNVPSEDRRPTHEIVDAVESRLPSSPRIIEERGDRPTGTVERPGIRATTAADALEDILHEEYLEVPSQFKGGNTLDTESVADRTFQEVSSGKLYPVVGFF